MDSLSIKFLVIGGIAAVLKDFWILCIKSFFLYLMRGEFNTDGNWKTADEYDHFNANLGKFQRRYITKYTLLGVQWGFFTSDGGYVKTSSNWFEWAKDKANRFPVQLQVNTDDKKAFLEFLMRRR